MSAAAVPSAAVTSAAMHSTAVASAVASASMAAAVRRRDGGRCQGEKRDREHAHRDPGKIPFPRSHGSPSFGWRNDYRVSLEILHQDFRRRQARHWCRIDIRPETSPEKDSSSFASPRGLTACG
jgi:hypothetical protein